MSTVLNNSLFFFSLRRTLDLFCFFLTEGSCSHRRGSAGANVISQYSLAVFLFGYICVRGLHRATWDGKVKASFVVFGSIPSPLPKSATTVKRKGFFPRGVFFLSLLPLRRITVTSKLYLTNLTGTYPVKVVPWGGSLELDVCH